MHSPRCSRPGKRRRTAIAALAASIGRIGTLSADADTAAKSLAATVDTASAEELHTDIAAACRATDEQLALGANLQILVLALGTGIAALLAFGIAPPCGARRSLQQTLGQRLPRRHLRPARRVPGPSKGRVPRHSDAR